MEPRPEKKINKLPVGLLPIASPPRTLRSFVSLALTRFIRETAFRARASVAQQHQPNTKLHGPASKPPVRLLLAATRSNALRKCKPD